MTQHKPMITETLETLKVTKESASFLDFIKDKKFICFSEDRKAKLVPGSNTEYNVDEALNYRFLENEEMIGLIVKRTKNNHPTDMMEVHLIDFNRHQEICVTLHDGKFYKKPTIMPMTFPNGVNNEYLQKHFGFQIKPILS